MKQGRIDARIPENWLFPLGAIALGLIALFLRYGLRKYQSIDYVYFLKPWYEHIQNAGFSAFKDNFSNYNLPYLYLLYLASLVHLPTLYAVKCIPILFDGLLAYAIYLTVSHFRKDRYSAVIAALCTLFLPTVFLNSSAWGQSDSIYTSFLILSFYATIKYKSFRTWVFWAIAFCFKLQAIFFLPFLLYIWLIRRNEKWWIPFISVPIFLVPFIPSLIAGRSFVSILAIYKSQATTSGILTWNAANFYQWIGGSQTRYFNTAGIALTLGVTVILLLGAMRYIHRKADQTHLLYFAALTLLIVPFFLPQMHDRYFYPAEIFTFIIAAVKPKYIPLAVSTQLIGLFSYTAFLFQMTPPISLGILAIFQLLNIAVLSDMLFFSKIMFWVHSEKD